MINHLLPPLKKVTIFILLSFLSTGLFAGEKTFGAFQLSCVALDYVDISVSLYGIEQGYDEVSSVSRLYTRSEALTLTIHTVLNIGTVMATNFIYKRDKRLAWVVVVGLNLIRAYVIYRNIRILTR